MNVCTPYNNFLFLYAFSIGRGTCYKAKVASQSRRESLNLENAWFNIRFLEVLVVVISQKFILVIDNKTHSLCL